MKETPVSLNVRAPSSAMRRRRSRSATASLKRLSKVFERSEASLVHSLPIRKTICGIWGPTPVRVIEEAIAVLEDIGLLGGALLQRIVVDAGTGDGRIPVVLAAIDPTRPVYGIEQDPALFAQALVNLQDLRAKSVLDHTRIYLVEGDYCEMATYEAAGLDFRQTGIIFNYPDGNQRRLARFIAEYGGADTRLCLLTHDPSLEVEELQLRVRRDVTVAAESSWRLSVYGRG